MLDYKTVKKLLKSYPEITMSYPYGDDIEVYYLGEEMFALLYKDLLPLQLSLRCDRLLAKHLQEKFESVLGGRDLNPNKWITLILSGQLNEEEVRDLIRHSFEMTKKLN